MIHALGRRPDFVIGGIWQPYLLRWFVIPRNKVFNVYLHCILRSDDDRALHDHPWWNLSIILSGSYREVMPDFTGAPTIFTRIADLATRSRVLRPGSVRLRAPSDSHRLEVVDGPVWTLFITGPRVREWGFHCPQGWKHWRLFTNPRDSGQIGPGCDP